MHGSIDRHPSSEAQPLALQVEYCLEDTPEMFISPAGARQLVVMGMRGRLDPATGQLMPLEEELCLVNGPGYMMKPLPSRLRYDMVLPELERTLPYSDGGMLKIRQDYNVADALYKGLTGERRTRLNAADIERLMYEQVKLEQTLAERVDLTWTLNKQQTQDAYHVAQKEKTTPYSDGQLVSPVRIYAPGGTHGVQLMNRVMEAGADFASAKVWVPQAAYGEQNIRHDTPIFTANTVEQLRSVVGALRSVAVQGLTRADITAPLGVAIDGVSGAFVAQPIHQSFNGEMSKFWSEPVRIACNSLPLHAGQVVTAGWLDEAARRTCALAQQRAQAAGINPACHALVLGQRMEVVMDAIRI